MNELSLFSGIGGGCLASLILGHKIIGYVEKNEYCQKIIRARIDDGILHDAPIFNNIETFIDQGHCEFYKGVTECVSAGFPCQPFSVAGKRQGEKDERNMWPATCEVIRRIEPRYAFLENVPGLTYSGYLGRILQDLAEIGYDAKWMHLSASDCGAPHKRERLWILAYAKNEQPRKYCSKRNVAYTDSEQAKRPSIAWEECNPWRIESGLDRVIDGYPGRMDEIKALGNAQVPIVAARAFIILMGSLWQD